MSVTHFKKWDVTAIEIALDLEIPRFVDPSRFLFSGPAEPRICLVAAYALTSQLKRIVAAVDRAMPPRPTSALRISPGAARSPTAPAAAGVSIQPMYALLRLQSKLIRAIEPGLADGEVTVRTRRGVDNAAARFIGGFIIHKTLPTFEPPCALSADFDATELRVTGLTIYRLGDAGAPESILAHWPYANEPGSVHLLGGP
jgi:hypothetical protein